MLVLAEVLCWRASPAADAMVLAAVLLSGQVAEGWCVKSWRGVAVWIGG